MWNKNLTKSESAVVQEILDQVPTAMGFRDAFEGILDKLGKGGGAEAKFRYIFIDEGYGAKGTNDTLLAKHIAEDFVVFDVIEGIILGVIAENAEIPEIDPADYEDANDSTDDL